MKKNIILTAIAVLLIFCPLTSAGEKVDKERVKELIKILLDPKSDDFDKEKAIYDVSDLRAKEAVEALLTILKHDEEDLRKAAAVALGRIGDKRAASPLVKMFNAENPTMERSIILDALGMLGHTAAKHIAECLGVKDYDLRIKVIRTLGKIGGRESVGPLCGLLKDEDSRIRDCAAISLGKIGHSDAVKPLIALLDDKSEMVRKTASRAIIKIGEAAVKELVVMLKDKDPKNRELAVRTLGSISSDAACEELIEMLSDDDESVRQEAATALGNCKNKSVVQPLIKALTDPDSGVQACAAWALGHAGDARAVKPLIDFLKKASSKASASRALENLTGKDFGKDEKKWLEWYADNKDELEKAIEKKKPSQREIVFADVQEILDELGRGAAVKYVTGLGNIRKVVNGFHFLVLDFHHKARSTKDVLLFGLTGAGYCMRISEKLEEKDKKTSDKLKLYAAIMATNVASFTWSGWGEDDLKITPVQKAEGLSAAKFALKIKQELKVDDGKMSYAWWTLGAQLMAHAEIEKAIKAFTKAKEHAEKQKDNAEGAAMAEGYIALSKIIAGKKEADKDFKSAIDKLKKIGSKDALFYARQLRDVRKVFEKE